MVMEIEELIPYVFEGKVSAPAEWLWKHYRILELHFDSILHHKIFDNP